MTMLAAFGADICAPSTSGVGATTPKPYFYLVPLLFPAER